MTRYKADSYDLFSFIYGWCSSRFKQMGLLSSHLVWPRGHRIQVGWAMATGSRVWGGFNPSPDNFSWLSFTAHTFGGKRGEPEEKRKCMRKGNSIGEDALPLFTFPCPLHFTPPFQIYGVLTICTWRSVTLCALLDSGFQYLTSSTSRTDLVFIWP